MAIRHPVRTKMESQDRWTRGLLFDGRILRESDSQSIRSIGGLTHRPAESILYNSEIRASLDYDSISSSLVGVHYRSWELFSRHESYINNQREIISPKLPITGFIESDEYW